MKDGADRADVVCPCASGCHRPDAAELVAAFVERMPEEGIVNSQVVDPGHAEYCVDAVCG